MPFPYALLNALSAAISMEVENERLSGLHCEDALFIDGSLCSRIGFPLRSLSMCKRIYSNFMPPT